MHDGIREIRRTFTTSVRTFVRFIGESFASHNTNSTNIIIQDDESFDISKFTIGHVLKVPPKQSGQQLTADSFLVSEWKENLDNVRRKLVQRERALDFVTIQLPLMQHLSKTEDIKSLLTEFEEHFAENPVENRSGLPITPAVTRLGLDFDSNFFVGSPGLEVDKLIAILQPLADSRQLGALTVASNCLTYPHSHALLQWGKKQGIQTVSTEVTRVHHTRPGVLPANFQHASLHKPVDAPKKETFVGSSSAIDREQRCVQEIVEAVEDFKMAMDRCIGMEKKFLEEVSFFVCIPTELNSFSTVGAQVPPSSQGGSHHRMSGTRSEQVAFAGAVR